MRGSDTPPLNKENRSPLIVPLCRNLAAVPHGSLLPVSCDAGQHQHKRQYHPGGPAAAVLPAPGRGVRLPR